MPAIASPPPTPPIEALTCEGAGAFGAGVMAAVALVMLIVGFLLGTRGRQIAQSLKHLGEAIRSITVRIPKTLDADAAAAAAAGADDNDVEDEGPSAAADLMDEFLSVEQTGLDDHPDVLVNPVLLYQIRLEKDRQRALKRLEEMKKLLGDTEGMSEDEIAQRLAEQELAGGGQAVGDGKQNALAMLISVGARVTSTSSASSEHAAVAERRRTAKNIDVFLQRTRDIETSRAPPKKKQDKLGVRLPTADEVARTTGHTRHVVHSGLARLERGVSVGRSSRSVLREWNLRRRSAPGYESPYNSDEERDRQEERERIAKEKRERRGNMGAVSKADLAALAAELADEDSEEEDGEGRKPDADEEELAA